MREGLWGLHPKVEKVTNKNGEDVLTSSVQDEMWEEDNRERGFPGGISGKEPSCQCRSTGDLGSIPGLVRSFGGGHTPVFLLGESHQQRSLAEYSPYGHKGSDTTEAIQYTHKPESSQVVAVRGK